MSTNFLSKFLCKCLLFFQSPNLCCQQDTPSRNFKTSIELSTLRIRASSMSSAEFIELSPSFDLWLCFLFGLVRFVRMWSFSPQLQHVTFVLFGDFLRFFDFDHPCLFGLFDLLLPLRSTLRALSDESSISRLRIFSLRTASRISSNFSLSDPCELLIAATIVSYDSGKDNIKINVLISSSKIISTELNLLTIIYTICNRSTFRHL